MGEAVALPLEKACSSRGKSGGTGTTRKRKRRKFSKHVLEARKRKKERGQRVQDGGSTPATQPSSTKKRKPAKIKDPEEAASYLKRWREHTTAGACTQRNEDQEEQPESSPVAPAAWKFNKNTQSWLIRHMYDSENVSKSSFCVLVEYLRGMPDRGKTRILSDATRRALRYKDYEKEQAQKTEYQTKDSRKGDDDEETGGSNEKEDEETAGRQPEDDESRWKRLSDHDKRKEYKRARKVLDILKE